MQEPVYIIPGKEGFKGQLLDRYLALGYYRMQHLIFTTTHTQQDTENVLLPVFWLRTVLAKLKEGKAAQAIRKKCAAFTIQIKDAEISEETEVLFALYREHVPFTTADTCRGYLESKFVLNPFHSKVIEIRDGNLLIASGYFDIGSAAISGILNFYHPSYQKYSLGKFLILLKIDYAIAHQISYYYTGYISTATDKFDYKLFPDLYSVEVYLPVEKSWVPYHFYEKDMLENYYFENLI